MPFLALILTIGLWISPIFYIRNINQLQKEIFQHYEQKRYAEVIRLSQQLIQDYKFENEYLRLNMAHAYFLMQDWSKAIEYYNLILQTSQPDLQAIALLQLAVIAESEGHTEEALQLLKKAILLYPANATARYNYELLKKRIKNNSPPAIHHLQTPHTNSKSTGRRQNIASILQKVSTQTRKTTTLQAHIQGKEHTNKQSDKGKQDKEHSAKSLKINKLRQINLDIDKANQILDAMRQQEVQYLQQRKYPATPLPPNKPPW